MNMPKNYFDIWAFGPDQCHSCTYNELAEKFNNIHPDLPSLPVRWNDNEFDMNAALVSILNKYYPKDYKPTLEEINMKCTKHKR